MNKTTKRQARLVCVDRSVDDGQTWRCVRRFVDEDSALRFICDQTGWSLTDVHGARRQGRPVDGDEKGSGTVLWTIDFRRDPRFPEVQS